METLKKLGNWALILSSPPPHFMSSIVLKVTYLQDGASTSVTAETK